MMDAGFPKSRRHPQTLTIFLKMKEIITSAPLSAFGNLVPRDVASRATKKRLRCRLRCGLKRSWLLHQFCRQHRRYGRSGSQQAWFCTTHQRWEWLLNWGGSCKIRQPVWYVQADYRWRPIWNANAVYPAVHYTIPWDYGLIITSLTTMYGALRIGRGQLQRSWCQPSWSLCTYAGPCRWLFCCLIP